MTIKDAHETAGIRTTGGAPELRDHVPTQNSVAVQRLLDAGVIILGKTNVPLYSSDLQTFNELFGTTHNPHDTTRTPGGSSGGAAASLACGFTGLELGSDIGGSIRTPAHWTGVFGHKPSYGIVPGRGHIPGPPGTLSEPDLAVIGPLARSAEDLELALEVVAGPDAARARAYSLQLPPPRHARVQDFRVAAWLDDPACAVDSAVREQLERAVQALRDAGAHVDTEARPDFTLSEVTSLYFRLLHPIMVSGMPEAVLDMLAAVAADDSDAQRGTELHTLAKNATATHLSWLRADERRCRYRARMGEFFERYDVLLCPVNPVTAIPHDQEGNQVTRRIRVDGQERPYSDLMAWISLATACGLPATVAPVGQTETGLPVGAQLVGPLLEDRTPIALAGHLERLLGGFAPPARFQRSE
jgi:amidase